MAPEASTRRSDAAVARRPDKTERVNLRVDPDTDVLLREAAALAHQTLSAFVLDAATKKAREALEQQRRLRLSAEEFHRVLDELERPAEINPDLQKLAERVQARSARD
jgi:uncharacterized protein (DUF1778 family)